MSSGRLYPIHDLIHFLELWKWQELVVANIYTNIFIYTRIYLLLGFIFLCCLLLCVIYTKIIYIYMCVCVCVFYRIQEFNAAFTRAIQKPLSWAEPNQFLALKYISLKSTLIPSSHLRLDFLRGFFPVGLPLKKVLLDSSIRATGPAHVLYLITNTHQHIPFIKYAELNFQKSNLWVTIHKIAQLSTDRSTKRQNVDGSMLREVY